MEKIRILSTDSTKNDDVVKALIGTTWTDFKKKEGYIIINCCCGIKLEKGEFEYIQ
ncbi:hypothetical protein QTG56_24280 (plasmid) [Rossellomorea sp. AcN35-11]|nr:hypothetical protein [Rossellomorea aquimaris]WJV31758.1 hypothetical protein QTG56_24280 [Rossellomorea sp. AcN35-11]